MRTNTKITFYDLNDLDYSSYFLTGFHYNRRSFQYNFNISKRIPAFFSDEIINDQWKDILFSICLFKVKLADEEFYFCIDTRDSCEAAVDKGKGYHLPILKKIKYYFKVNYNPDSINNDPNLKDYANKIYPSLPFFAILPPQLSAYIPRIIPSYVYTWNLRDILRRIITPKRMLSLEQLKKMRNSKKDIDVFFVVRFYDDKVHSKDNEFRYQIMKEIQKYPDINSVVGFTCPQTIANNKYAAFQVEPYSLKDYLSYVVRSRVSIYVRGLHNCLSFKFGQLLLLGNPIIGQKVYNNKDNIMYNKYFNEQFAFDDPKEIVREVVKLLENKDKQKMFAESNKNIFDTRFSPEAVVSNILEQMNFTKQSKLK